MLCHCHYFFQVDLPLPHLHHQHFIAVGAELQEGGESVEAVLGEVQFADGVYSFQVEPCFIVAEDVIVYIFHLQQVLHNHVQVSFPDVLFQAMHNMMLVMVERVEGMVPGDELSFPSLPLELGPTTPSFLHQLMH
jgi:hypothetical protein